MPPPSKPPHCTCSPGRHMRSQRRLFRDKPLFNLPLSVGSANRLFTPSAVVKERQRLLAAVDRLIGGEMPASLDSLAGTTLSGWNLDESRQAHSGMTFITRRKPSGWNLTAMATPPGLIGTLELGCSRVHEARDELQEVARPRARRAPRGRASMAVQLPQLSLSSGSCVVLSPGTA